MPDLVSAYITSEDLDELVQSTRIEVRTVHESRRLRARIGVAIPAVAAGAAFWLGVPPYLALGLLVLGLGWHLSEMVVVWGAETHFQTKLLERVLLTAQRRDARLQDAAAGRQTPERRLPGT